MTLGFFSLLFLLLMTLKIIGYISVSWWILVGILAVPLAFILVAIFFFGAIALMAHLKQGRKDDEI